MKLSVAFATIHEHFIEDIPLCDNISILYNKILTFMNSHIHFLTFVESATSESLASCTQTSMFLFGPKYKFQINHLCS